MNKSRRILSAVVTALVIGIGLPGIDVVVKCERSRARIRAVCLSPAADGPSTCPATSEACVWGKSLLPLSIGAHLFLLGVPAALLVYWWSGRRLSRAHREPGTFKK
jgi:hypothetical protein